MWCTLGLAGALDALKGLSTGATGSAAAVIAASEVIAYREGTGSLDALLATLAPTAGATATVVTTVEIRAVGDTETGAFVANLLWPRACSTGSSAAIRPTLLALTGFEYTSSADAVLPTTTLSAEASAAVRTADLSVAKRQTDADSFDALVVELVTGTAGPSAAVVTTGLSIAVRDAGTDTTDADLRRLLTSAAADPTAAIVPAVLTVAGVKYTDAVIAGLAAVTASTAASASVTSAFRAKTSRATSTTAVVLCGGLTGTVGAAPLAPIGRAGRFSITARDTARTRVIADGVALAACATAAVVPALLTCAIRDTGAREGACGAAGLVHAGRQEKDRSCKQEPIQGVRCS